MSIAKFTRATALGVLMVAGLTAFVGCEAKGPAERAGEKVDRGIENVKDAVTPAGPVERAGEKIDRGVQNAKDAVMPPGPGEKAGREVDKVLKP